MRCDCPLSALLWKMFAFYRLWRRNTDRRRCCTRTNNCIGTIYGTATKSLSTASWIVLYRRRRPRLPYVHEEGSQANHRTIRNIPDSCWDPADLQWKVNEISRFRSRINLYVERLGIFLHITHTHTRRIIVLEKNILTYRFFRVEKELIMIRLKGAFVRE